ncbi:MAG: RNA polymerase sigma factor [Anaerosomatales bacterium]
MEAVAMSSGMRRAVAAERSASQPRAAFSALIREHDRSLRVLAYRMLGDRDEMDDVLQDAYLKAYRAFREFRGDAAAGTWLYRITYNACIDRLRRRRPDMGYLDELSEAGFEPASREDVAVTAQLRTDLQGALAILPEEQRAAVLLVDALGWDYAEAAEVLGIARGTLGSRLHRARAVLRHALGDRGEVV